MRTFNLFRALAFLPMALQAENAPPPQFLLPGTVQPKRYALELTILPSETSFHGLATIDLELKEKTSLLWLNGKDLSVESAVLKADRRSLSADVVAAGEEFLGFALPQPVGPGPARLEIRYQAKLNENAPVGAFRKQAAGDWYAFTTFTAIDARRAF